MGAAFKQLKVAFLFILLWGMHPASVHAFKVDAHIWVAQQVLNDARDGRLGVRIQNRIVELSISPRYSKALRNHPTDFLLGSLGPDAFPDAIGGQMVIHPSVKGGWGTSDFLHHLLSDPDLTDRELSFVLGYYTHAAGDVFAHTFVNRYAGDLFELKDHYWASVRHINIESYLSKFLPPMNAAGTAPANVLRPGRELEIPVDLMVRRFLFNDVAIEQFRKAGGAMHIVAAYDLYQSLGKFLSEDGLLLKLEAIGLRYGIEAATGIPLALAQAEELQKLSNRVTAELNNYAGDVAKYAQEVNSKLGEIEGLRNELIAKGMTEALSIGDDLVGLSADIARKTLEVAKLLNDLDGIPAKVADEVCDKLKNWLGKFAGWACRTVMNTNPAWTAKKHAIDLARKAVDGLEKEYSRLTQVGKQAIRDGLRIIQTELNLRISLTNHLIGLLGNHPFSSQFRRPFEIWRHNIPVAMAAYTKANAEVIVNSIDPDVVDSDDPNRPGLLTPMTDWLKCYLPAIATPIPVELSGGVCEVFEGIREIEEQIDDLVDTLAKLTPITEELNNLHDELKRGVEQLKRQLFGIAIKEGLGWFDKQADTNTLDFYKALAEPATRATVNDVMSRDDSNQGLLLIPDTAERMEAEMRLAGGKLDPNEFAPIYDAVVLSKLTLLDNAGLVRLSRLAGVTDTVFGRNLYEEGGPVANNILYGFVQNIDGNHHWHDLAPPHPRVGGEGFDGKDFDDRRANLDNRYGYADNACPRVLGMRMWVDETARTTLFKQLFKGKIALGVDDPAQLGFGPVLDPNYPPLLNGDWLEDGDTFTHGAVPPKQRFSVSLPVEEDGSVEVSVAGAVVSTTPVLAGKTFATEIEVSSFKPERISIVVRDADGSHRSFQATLNCDGAADQISAETRVTVVKGDSLWRISERLIGDGARWPELFEANRETIENPNLIFPGQVFMVPWHPAVTITRVP